MGASASQPWHHPTSKASNQPATTANGHPCPCLSYRTPPTPSPCLVSRRAAHVVVVGEKSSRIAEQILFLSRARKQQAPKSACMTLPVRRLDTSVASCIVDAIHNSPLTTTTHRRPSPRPDQLAAGAPPSAPPPPSPHHPPLTPLCPCPGVAWLHPAVMSVWSVVARLGGRCSWPCCCCCCC